MSPNIVTVTPSLPYTAEIRGKSALRVLKRAGTPKMFAYKPASGREPCWTFPRQLIADVQAAAETLRGVVLIVEHQQETLL